MGGPSGSHSHIVAYPVLALEPPLACLISSVWVQKIPCSIIPFCNSGVFFYFCCLSVDILTDFPALVVIPSHVRRNQHRNKEKLTDVKKGCDHGKRYRENTFCFIGGPGALEH